MIFPLFFDTPTESIRWSSGEGIGGGSGGDGNNGDGDGDDDGPSKNEIPRWNLETVAMQNSASGSYIGRSPLSQFFVLGRDPSPLLSSQYSMLSSRRARDSISQLQHVPFWLFWSSFFLFPLSRLHECFIVDENGGEEVQGDYVPYWGYLLTCWPGLAMQSSLASVLYSSSPSSSPLP